MGIINDTLTFNPIENFHIEEGTEVTIRATDDEAAFNDTSFTIVINPVNDLPTAFSLLTPADDSYIADTIQVDFSWQESVDIVEDSSG